MEYISLPNNKGETLENSNGSNEALACLLQLADSALKNGPYSITFDKKNPHIAPTGDVRDFLSYAPYWWPENASDPNTKYIRKDGKRNPDAGIVKDQQQLELFAENVMYLCLGYYFFKEEKYALHAVSLLKTFFLHEVTRMNSHLDYAQLVRGSQNTTRMGRGEGIISSRALCRVANVLPLIGDFDGYRKIHEPMMHWFSCFLKWLYQSPVAKQALKSKNNIYTWRVVHLVSIERFLNPSSPALVTCIKDFFEKSLPVQIDGKTGNQPFEAKRAQPFHYLAFNMRAILYIAEVARSIGFDAYLLKKDLLHLAAKYISQYEASDITEAARCVDIISKRICIQGCCKSFVECCYRSKYADKISGPKHIICSLWL